MTADEVRQQAKKFEGIPVPDPCQCEALMKPPFPSRLPIICQPSEVIDEGPGNYIKVIERGITKWRKADSHLGAIED